MFRKNKRHLQAPMFSDLDNLSAKARKRLEVSWAGAFRREFFSRIDEDIFAGLYSDEPSRPNTPVNILVSLEALKSGFGWSDEEMHDHFLFDVQVRYALGLDNLGAGEFDLRTLYNFRHRLSEHMQMRGENLIERAFEQITDEQVKAFELQTGRLRMDSTQIASNIRQMSRVQLLVEVLQRVHRMLDESDQAHYAADFAPYLQGSSGQYVYHLKGEETGPHLERIGQLMQRLLAELAPAYSHAETYQILARVFREQFIVSAKAHSTRPDDPTGAPPDDLSGAASGQPREAGSEPGEGTEIQASQIQVRPGKDVSPSRLRSPDDPDATFRKKAGKVYEGYAVNFTETCEPKNDFQLVLKVQTAPNLTEDADFLLQALPNLVARTQCYQLYNDAAFCSPDVDEALRQEKIIQIPTDLRGKAPNPERTSLTDLEAQFDEQGCVTALTCPHGHTFPVKPGRKVGRFITQVKEDPCPECDFTRPALNFSQVELDRALRRQRSRAYRQAGHNLRAAVEATVGAAKRPFNDDQLPVRGQFRMSVMMIGSAAMLNIRRIQRYLADKCKKEQEKAPKRDLSAAVLSFLSRLGPTFRQQLRFVRPFCSALALDF